MTCARAASAARVAVRDAGSSVGGDARRLRPLGFGTQESDIRLAFQRLDKALEPAGTSLRHTAVSNVYPLTRSTSEMIRKVRQEFYDKANPRASTMVLFEGLPSLDASFGIDVLAVVR
ncbi:MAG: hypothetical protein HYZ57_04360 [Acidobacteria bacterium]|nr:hypothetical protein [Acidobacteriota bacterium]MBI3279060.1 hypothetical protein [Acidobacteriota bacterium]